MNAQMTAGATSDLPLSSARYAILIGVEKYEDVNIPALTGPASDVELLKSALENYAGFLADNIFILSTDPKQSQPTRSQILFTLSKIKNAVPKDGLLLFMFSGHGVAKGDIAYLLPSDVHQTGDSDLMSETALPVDLIRDRVAATGVKQAIVLIDACRNDPEQSKGEIDNPLTTAFTKGFDFEHHNMGIEASMTFYATSIGGRAWIDQQRHLSYFTEVLADGLSGSAARGNSAVSLNDLISYVQETVPHRVTTDLGPNHDQRPSYVIAGYRPAELVISNVRNSNAVADTSTKKYPFNLSIDLHKPIPANIPELDFALLFERNKNDGIALSHLGEAAFLQSNYTWTIRSLEQARNLKESDLWMVSYPLLAAAYLLDTGNKGQFDSALNEMVEAMQVPSTYFSRPIPISYAISNLTKIRNLLPESNWSQIDIAIDRATMIAAKQATLDRSPEMSVCKFYGEAPSGASAYQEQESCVIPNIAQIDKEYRQRVVNCCGGGATSTLTASDIPPGIELRISGNHYWSVRNPVLQSDKLALVLYCGPAGFGGPGCNVQTEVVAHYKLP